MDTLLAIAGRRVFVSEFVGNPREIIVSVPVRRRGFSIRRRRMIYEPTGIVYLLGTDACIMHPKDFEELRRVSNEQR